METLIIIAMASGSPASLLLVKAWGPHKLGSFDGVDGFVYPACRLGEGDISQLQSQAGWFPL